MRQRITPIGSSAGHFGVGTWAEDGSKGGLARGVVLSQSRTADGRARIYAFCDFPARSTAASRDQLIPSIICHARILTVLVVLTALARNYGVDGARVD